MLIGGYTEVTGPVGFTIDLMLIEADVVSGSLVPEDIPDGNGYYDDLVGYPRDVVLEVWDEQMRKPIIITDFLVDSLITSTFFSSLKSI